ncbi:MULTISPECIES: hypothetical protein [Shinella]|uniref:Uncharacterized protein n=1 Tax=Shinella sedimenti TaxID=2919913 RepID=A0ABT0CQV1_9HYPH|nr:MULTISPECIES: hypothetical protein [Shinella]MCJ8150958.1 hypothetical protein [Shinella sedimenti]
MDDDNIVKFERRKPQPEKKPATPRLQGGRIWLAILAAIVLVWAYYQFVAPQTL